MVRLARQCPGGPSGLSAPANPRPRPTPNGGMGNRMEIRLAGRGHKERMGNRHVPAPLPGKSSTEVSSVNPLALPQYLQIATISRGKAGPRGGSRSKTSSYANWMEVGRGDRLEATLVADRTEATLVADRTEATLAVDRTEDGRGDQGGASLVSDRTEASLVVDRTEDGRGGRGEASLVSDRTEASLVVDRTEDGRGGRGEASLVSGRTEASLVVDRTEDERGDRGEAWLDADRTRGCWGDRSEASRIASRVTGGAQPTGGNRGRMDGIVLTEAGRRVTPLLRRALKVRMMSSSQGQPSADSTPRVVTMNTEPRLDAKRPSAPRGVRQ